MKLLIDENLSEALAKRARELGHAKSSHVRWIGKGGIKDWNLTSVILEGGWTFVRSAPQPRESRVRASPVLTLRTAYAFCRRTEGLRFSAHGRDGAVAQLGERLVRNEEVRGSIPLSSTIPPRDPP